MYHFYMYTYIFEKCIADFCTYNYMYIYTCTLTRQAYLKFLAEYTLSRIDDRLTPCDLYFFFRKDC